MEDAQLVQGLLIKYRHAVAEKERLQEIFQDVRRDLQFANARIESFADTLKLLGTDPDTVDAHATLFDQATANAPEHTTSEEPEAPPIQLISEQLRPASGFNKTLVVLDVLRAANGTGLEPKEINDIVRQRGIDFTKNHIYPVLSKQVKAGKIQNDNGRYRLTALGRAFFESKEKEAEEEWMG